MEPGQVEHLGIDLAQRATFTGVAHAEMKYDQEQDRLVLIEANVGRPTGRLALPRWSGSNSW